MLAQCRGLPGRVHAGRRRSDLPATLDRDAEVERTEWLVSDDKHVVRPTNGHLLEVIIQLYSCTRARYRKTPSLRPCVPKIAIRSFNVICSAQLYCTDVPKSHAPTKSRPRTIVCTAPVLRRQLVRARVRGRALRPRRGFAEMLDRLAERTHLCPHPLDTRHQDVEPTQRARAADGGGGGGGTVKGAG